MESIAAEAGSETSDLVDPPAPPSSSRLGVGLLFFMNGALIATWVSRIPAVQAQLSLSHGKLGTVLLAGALGALLAMPGAGWCASRFGSRATCYFAAPLF